METHPGNRETAPSREGSHRLNPIALLYEKTKKGLTWIFTKEVPTVEPEDDDVTQGYVNDEWNCKRKVWCDFVSFALHSDTATYLIRMLS